MDVIPFIFYVLHSLARLYVIIILVHVILSLLVAFNVVNTRNQFVAIVWTLHLAPGASRCWPISGAGCRSCATSAGSTCRRSSC